MKLLTGASVEDLLSAYPRPDGRGPIEATFCNAEPGSPDATYPRPDGRGPIAVGAGTPIRDLTVAAPLKQTTVFAEPTQDYPRPDGRGPIEALLRAFSVRTSPTRYPRPDGRGPIEAHCHRAFPRH